MCKCSNKSCEYHVKGKCRLFPGEAMSSCKQSGYDSGKTTNNNQTKKGKK